MSLDLFLFANFDKFCTCLLVLAKNNKEITALIHSSICAQLQSVTITAARLNIYSQSIYSTAYTGKFLLYYYQTTLNGM